MDTKTVELSSKRKVKIKEMSIDDIDFCSDLTTLNYQDGEMKNLSGLAKSRTAWLRRGVAGGDFKAFKTDTNGYPVDKVLKHLTDDEKNELITVIQEHQQVGE